MLPITNNNASEHLKMGESLTAALQNPSCAHHSWLKNPNKNLCRLRCSADKDSLYWVDDEDHKICIAFPAILDMGGTYGRLDPYFSLIDHKSVCLYIYIYLY